MCNTRCVGEHRSPFTSAVHKCLIESCESKEKNDHKSLTFDQVWRWVKSYPFGSKNCQTILVLGHLVHLRLSLSPIIGLVSFLFSPLIGPFVSPFLSLGCHWNNFTSYQVVRFPLIRCLVWWRAINLKRSRKLWETLRNYHSVIITRTINCSISWPQVFTATTCRWNVVSFLLFAIDWCSP